MESKGLNINDKVPASCWCEAMNKTLVGTRQSHQACTWNVSLPEGAVHGQHMYSRVVNTTKGHIERKDWNVNPFIGFDPNLLTFPKESKEKRIALFLIHVG